MHDPFLPFLLLAAIPLFAGAATGCAVGALLKSETLGVLTGYVVGLMTLLILGLSL